MWSIYFNLLMWFNLVINIGHYRHYPIDYKAAVTELLGKAAAVYSQRIQRLEGERMGLEGTHDEIHPINGMRKAAASPTRSFRGTPLVPSDHFFMPSSLEYYDGRDVGSVQDQHKEELIHLHTPPSISAHGVLGQILFDVCVPKNVEGWDIRSSDSLNGRSYTSTRRHSPFNPIKCIRRSRLWYLSLKAIWIDRKNKIGEMSNGQQKCEVVDLLFCRTIKIPWFELVAFILTWSVQLLENLWRNI